MDSDTWRLKEEGGELLTTGKSRVMSFVVGLVCDDFEKKLEGTGFSGRVKESLERQEWKEAMTLENRSLKLFPILFVSPHLLCV